MFEGLIERLEKQVTELRQERDRLDWMLVEFMVHGHRYRKHRAGYADFWALIRKDLEEAYEDGHPPCDECGGVILSDDYAVFLEARDGAGELEQMRVCRKCAGQNEERSMEP